MGGGPGAPGLLTMRGAELLARADVVFYDYLVNPDLLGLARPGAERVCLGKHGATRVWTQDEIHGAMVESARRGLHVVRLKGGDPGVFGRCAEETAWLFEQGIPFEVVPGVTAASAVAAYTGVPLTHRRSASAAALVTGQSGTDPEATPLDFRQLAVFPGTLVVYMGVTTADRWVGALLQGGLAAETPCVLVRHCSLPDQTVVACALAEIPEAIRARALRPPVLACIGGAVSNRSVSWFETLPLFGKRVLVTRPAHQAADLSDPLRELGAHVVLQPAIRIDAPADWSAVDRALLCGPHWDWIVFSSANGVRFFLERLRSIGKDWRALGPARFAVIGPGTRRELERFGFLADEQPEAFDADALARGLESAAAGRRVLLVRASRGRDVLAERLAPRARELEQVVAYRSEDIDSAEPEVVEAMREGTLDWCTVTSSAIAASLVRLFGDALCRVRLASISPITSAALREHGFEPSVEADEQTMAGIVRAIVAWECSDSQSGLTASTRDTARYPDALGP